MFPYYYYCKYLECVDRIFQTDDRFDVPRAPYYMHEDAVVGFANSIINQAIVLSDTVHNFDGKEVDEFISWVMDIRATVDDAGIDPNRIRTAVLRIVGPC